MSWVATRPPVTPKKDVPVVAGVGRGAELRWPWSSGRRRSRESKAGASRRVDTWAQRWETEATGAQPRMAPGFATGGDDGTNPHLGTQGGGAAPGACSSGPRNTSPLRRSGRPDGKWIASARQRQRRVRLWDPNTGKLLRNTYQGTHRAGQRLLVGRLTARCWPPAAMISRCCSGTWRPANPSQKFASHQGGHRRYRLARVRTPSCR